MENEKLLKKLQIKSNSRMLLLNAPESFLAAMVSVMEGMSFSTSPEGSYDYVHLFAQNSSELHEHAAAALSAVKPDGLLWISYPKKSSKVPTDLSRDEGWTVITQAGYRPVRQVSIDSTWSAVRFRQQEVKTEEDIVNAQYKGAKAELRPLYDRLAEIVQGFGDDVELAPRKSYVAFSRGKIFALAKASTKTRLDLGLKLPNTPATDRLVEAPGFGSGSITHKVALHTLEDIFE